MCDPSVAALFPLPLVTFEKYMLLDDRPDYPMAFTVQIRLSGNVLRPAFEAALDEALLSHPLLCALVRHLAHGQPVWVLAERIRPIVDWNVLGAAIVSPHGAKIDLHSEVGLRIWVRQGDGVADVLLHFHHASCDGIGALRFIGHLLAAYGARTSPPGRCPVLPPSDPTSLLRRGCFAAPASPPVPIGRPRAIWSGVRDGVRWLTRRPAILAPSVPRSQSDPASLPLPGMDCHAFDRSETARLRQVGARQGVAINDLLLRDLFQTLGQWTAKHPSASAKPWLRIAIPVNLKTGDDERFSAANGVSYTFVTRHQNQCADADKLLQGIRSETDPATRRRRSMMFLGGVRLMERIPGAIPLYMSANRCFATVVLSNLGEITRQLGTRFPAESGKIVAGNLVLEDIFGVPPVRPNTRAAFMVGRYDERLWIGLRSDPLVFSPDDARRLLDLYVDRIRRTMDAAVEPTP